MIKNEQNADERERVLKLIDEAKKEGSFHWAGVFIEPEEAGVDPRPPGLRLTPA